MSEEELPTFIRELAAAPSLDPLSVLPEWAQVQADGAPRQLGPYRLRERIGEGGMGIVFLAEDERLRRTVALKVLRRRLTASADGEDWLVREARSLAAIRHPNIVTVHDIGTSDGMTYIAMELVPGRTLRSLLRDGPLPLPRALHILRQAVSALAAAHAAGILHCDLKPENILVGDDGTVKVLDFGLAQQLPSQVNGREARFSPGGTPGYMSPEQKRHQAIDSRSDVYSLGLVMLELLLGRLPPEQERQARGGAVAFIPRPKGARWLAPVLARCLATERDARLHSGVELAAAWVDAEQLHRRRFHWAVALASIVVLTAAMAGFVAWRIDVLRSAPSRAELQRLTANPPENPVQSAVFSPDRQRLAYVDDTGLQVRRLAPPETVAFPLPGEGYDVIAWNEPETLTLFRPTFGSAPAALIWMHLTSGVQRRIELPGATTVALSRDGARYAWDDAEGIHWRSVDAREGGLLLKASAGARQVATLAWSPEGDRLAMVRTQVRTGTFNDLTAVLETVDLLGRPAVPVLEDVRLIQETGDSALTWSAANELVFILAEAAPREPGSSLWAVQLDMTSGEVTQSPRHLWTSSPGIVSGLQSVAPGTFLFQRLETQLDVFTARIEKNRPLTELRRLTRSSRNERPSAYLPDGTGVLVVSNENGSQDVAVVKTDGSPAPLRWLRRGEGDQTWAIPAGDASYLFWNAPAGQSKVVLTRASLEGDAETPLFEVPISAVAPGIGMPPPRTVQVRCPRVGTAASCIWARVEDDALVFGAVGESAPLKLPRIPRTPLGGLGWDLSPDGRTLVVPEEGGRLGLFPLDGGAPSVWGVNDACLLQYAAFGASAEEVFVSGICTGDKPYTLLRAAAKGSDILLQTAGDWLAHPVTSPDGRALAFARKEADDDIWLVRLDTPDR